MRPLALLALLVSACTTPGAATYVPAPSGGAAMLLVGQTAAGEDCRMARTGSGADIWCGDWQTPSARVRATGEASAETGAAAMATAVVAQLDCAAPRPTTALGGQPAALLQCRRRAG